MEGYRVGSFLRPKVSFIPTRRTFGKTVLYPYRLFELYPYWMPGFLQKCILSLLGSKITRNTIYSRAEPEIQLYYYIWWLSLLTNLERLRESTSKAVYDAWYDEVYEPQLPAEEDEDGEDSGDGGDNPDPTPGG